MKTALNQLKEWLENATKQCEETYNATDAEKFPSTSISTYAMLSAYNMVLDQIKELLPTEREQIEKSHTHGRNVERGLNDEIYTAEQYFKETYNE